MMNVESSLFLVTCQAKDIRNPISLKKNPTHQTNPAKYRFSTFLRNPTNSPKLEIYQTIRSGLHESRP